MDIRIRRELRDESPETECEQKVTVATSPFLPFASVQFAVVGTSHLMHAAEHSTLNSGVSND